MLLLAPITLSTLSVMTAPARCSRLSSWNLASILVVCMRSTGHRLTLSGKYFVRLPAIGVFYRTSLAIGLNALWSSTIPALRGSKRTSPQLI